MARPRMRRVAQSVQRPVGLVNRSNHLDRELSALGLASKVTAGKPEVARHPSQLPASVLSPGWGSRHARGLKRCRWLSTASQSEQVEALIRGRPKPDLFENAALFTMEVRRVELLVDAIFRTNRWTFRESAKT